MISISKAKVCQFVNESFPDIYSKMKFYQKMVRQTRQELDTLKSPDICDANVLEFFKQVFPGIQEDCQAWMDRSYLSTPTKAPLIIIL